LLHLPPAAAKKRVPLVLLFHGDGATANEIMSASRMNEYADTRGVAVAYPNGTGSFPFIGLHWNVGTCCGYAVKHHVNDIGFSDALVSIVSRETAVDSSRVYAAGFSAGGMLALRLACERAVRFHAVADVAGAMPDTTCVPAGPVSVLFFQGQKDDDLRFDFHDLLRRGRSFATSLEAAMRFWSRRDGCATAPTRDSTAAYHRDRATCPTPLSVELYTVRHHPHAWPGGERNWFFEPDPAQTVKASPLILDFFAQHAR
jgi:polyhydroxybutyrate depolymerase